MSGPLAGGGKQAAGYQSCRRDQLSDGKAYGFQRRNYSGVACLDAVWPVRLDERSNSGNGLQCAVEHIENLRGGRPECDPSGTDSPPQMLLDGAGVTRNEMDRWGGGWRAGGRETPLTLQNVTPTPEPMNDQGKEHRLF